MAINVYISDMFFNRDLSDCQNRDEEGNFAGWKMDRLQEEAYIFVAELDGFANYIGGVFFAPNEDEIVNDFLQRA